MVTWDENQSVERALPLINKKSVSLDKLVAMTGGLSYVNIRDLLDNGLEYAKSDRKVPRNDIRETHLVQAFNDIYDSRGKPVLQKPYERSGTVYHELGHAFVSAFLPGMPHPEVVNLSGVSSLGSTLERGNEGNINDAEITVNTLACWYGGMAAESLVFKKDRSGGGSEDFKEANEVATDAVLKDGLSVSSPPSKESEGVNILPPFVLDEEDYGVHALTPKTRQDIETKVGDFQTAALVKAREVLTGHKYEFLKISEVCINTKRKFMSGSELEAELEKWSTEKKKFEAKGGGALETEIQRLEKTHQERLTKERREYQKALKEGS
ncbi:hypothetical protein ACFLRC_04895, partial [Candidatus Altiarchaeota archaeon]